MFNSAFLDSNTVYLLSFCGNWFESFNFCWYFTSCKKRFFYKKLGILPIWFSWHSAILAPVFVIAFVLFKNTYLRILIIVESLICGNSTSFIGVVICIIILGLNKLKNIKISRKINPVKIIVFTAAFIIFFIVILKTGLFEALLERMHYLINRIKILQPIQARQFISDILLSTLKY